MNVNHMRHEDTDDTNSICRIEIRFRLGRMLAPDCWPAYAAIEDASYHVIPDDQQA